MTKKDYIKLADVMRVNKPNPVNGYQGLITWDRILSDLMVTLKSDNPRFNKDRFMTACGVEK